MLDLENYLSSFAHNSSRTTAHLHHNQKPALVVGSAPAALSLAEKHLDGVRIVAINNAWRIRPDTDYAIYASDFPEANRPPRSMPAVQITGPEYGPALATAGGEILAGATMAFVAGYWGCETLRTPVIGFYGCDMVYSPSGQTHFYGKGSPDPLREHISLRSLEAKAMRLFCWALKRHILLVNCSRSETSHLVFPRVPLSRLGELPPPGRQWQALIARAKHLFEEERQPPYDAYRRDVLDGPETARCLEIIDRMDRQWLALIPMMNDILDAHGVAGNSDRPGHVGEATTTPSEVISCLMSTTTKP